MKYEVEPRKLVTEIVKVGYVAFPKARAVQLNPNHNRSCDTMHLISHLYHVASINF